MSYSEQRWPSRWQSLGLLTFPALLLAYCPLLVPVRAADPMEIIVDLGVTRQDQKNTRSYEVRATCIVGSNSWFISGDFMGNARRDYWLAGSNVVQRTIITSGMYLERAKKFVSEQVLGQEKLPIGHSYAQPGTTNVSVVPWMGELPWGGGAERLVWLAYCSGEYLKRNDRSIPLPLGPGRQAAGYLDETIVFEDELGLPKSVRLLAANGNLACQYEVMATTNVFGRLIPLEFRLIQHSMRARGATNGATTTVEGKVRGVIKASHEPVIPEEVRKQLAR